ncbi:MAG: hypothetical protein LC658_10370, partial [Bacteroidales bacterium]|nr:hypothetical protein [Bacteroidales bacterium]
MTFKILLKVLKYVIGLVLSGMAILFVVLFIPAIWRNLITYPKLDKAVSEFNERRKEPARVSDLNTFRGIIHAHSFWSHDSEGT